MNKSTGLDAAGEPAEPTCDSDKCYICLSLIKNQTVGSLDKCLHVFCLQCILQWSQTANTCPVDRISFAFIHQRRSPAGVVQKQIRVTPERKDGDDEEEGVSPVICEECGRSDRRHRLLLCARCDSGGLRVGGGGDQQWRADGTPRRGRSDVVSQRSPPSLHPEPPRRPHPTTAELQDPEPRRRRSALPPSDLSACSKIPSAGVETYSSTWGSCRSS
ncbi:PHD and RING finger domain-containing protein 1 isoform X2 [Kryptolebias marmoratus]|uniref:PHD and RING finger domain-containing protein 1 isoform X2 n=1 Tax=Kryptolebias marmoratus TaxID=37003 RepID=UPI0007F8F41C|nr:PHD and RING finger domain-containing protein 1 isoform X2 [Kryptolebias marmoratus]